MRKDVYMRKFVFLTYMIFVITMSIGWYPEQRDTGLSDVVKETKTLTAELCLMEENQTLFQQGVRETSEEERKQREQQEEMGRRALTVEEKTEETMSCGEESRTILERIVEAEAGDQDIKGRILVANVVLNRVSSSEFPNTVKGVVFSPRQFSPIADGSYDSVKVSKLTKKAVRLALQGEDYSEGALYFMCRSASSPSNAAWFDRDLKRLFSYGCHEFFR
jgi:N-acetylmuramoyl-L-alanine amidase